jgi:hypothetical protein
VNDRFQRISMKKYLFFTLVLYTAVLLGGAAFAEGVKVASFEGDVKVTAQGSDVPVACEAGMDLASGATIDAGEGAYATIAFDASGANVVRITDGSMVVLRLGGPDKIELKSGEAFISLEGLKEDETFRIRTPYAICGARGTAWNVKVSDNMVHISVLKGRVFVRGIGRNGAPMEGELLLEKGYETVVRKFERPRKYEKISQESMGHFEKENAPFVTAALSEEKQKSISREKPAETVKTLSEVPEPAKPKVNLVGERAAATVPAEGELGEEDGLFTVEETGENKEDAAGIAGEMSQADPVKSDEEEMKLSSGAEIEPAVRAAEKKNVTVGEVKKKKMLEDLLEETSEDASSSQPAEL